MATPPKVLTLYVATSNAGKLRDFAYAAEHAQSASSQALVRLATLPRLESLEAPEENSDTFEGNAQLKAEYYSQHAPGLWVLCDDSGLEVDALEGRPGVRSARFAADLGFGSGDAPPDENNNEALLLEMTEQTERAARYRCVLALARDGVVLYTATGTLEGELRTEAAGDGGFGYDPLFYAPEAGCTMAQAEPQARLELSHRGRALRQLLACLPHPA